MNLGMFDRFCASLKARVQLEEIIDLNKFDRNIERYVIPMNKKIFWSNNWIQEPRKNFRRVQVHHYDPSAQYKRSWGMYKRKRGWTLCYNCIRLVHLAKECPGVVPICLYCKVAGHEVEDCAKMIAKVEEMNTSQENKSMLENHIAKESEKVQNMLV
jgi:hypothetical protein